MRINLQTSPTITSIVARIVVALGVIVSGALPVAAAPTDASGTVRRHRGGASPARTIR